MYLSTLQHLPITSLQMPLRRGNTLDNSPVFSSLCLVAPAGDAKYEWVVQSPNEVSRQIRPSLLICISVAVNTYLNTHSPRVISKRANATYEANMIKMTNRMNWPSASLRAWFCWLNLEVEHSSLDCVVTDVNYMQQAYFRMWLPLS
jgi:hypothetical protein